MGKGIPAHLIEATERAARRWIGRAQPWPDRLARCGFVAKGALFLLVGGLAAAQAAGLGGAATDQSGALVMLRQAPAGRLALVVVALGLLAHAGFRGALVLTGEPYDDRGRALRALRRMANVVSAAFYLGLAITAGALAFSARAQRHADKDAATRHWSARLLSAPFGRPLLIGIAVAIVVAAVVQLVRAFLPSTGHLRMRIEDMSARELQTVSAVGRIAFVARAAVLAVVGYFLIEAAVHGAPRLSRGAAGALRAVREQPHGHLLLGLLATGLMAFGAHGLLEARWHRLFGR